MVAFAVEWLTKLFGSDVGAAVKKSSATRWNAAPFALGAMSAAGPGGQSSRKVLTEPIGCMYLAGEATHETLWGTVDGAWESGERAAEAALRRIGALKDPEPRRRRPAKQRRRRRHPRSTDGTAESADLLVERQGQRLCAARSAARGRVRGGRRADDGDRDVRSGSIHGVRQEILRAQCEAAGLPQRIVPIPYPCPNEIYEARMGEAVAHAVRDGITHMIFGDLFLADIRAYREQKLAGTGITPVFPLWDRPTPAAGAGDDRKRAGGDIATVDLKKLPAEFAGRKFDAQLLADLPDGVDPCGENGEFHTCVVAGPMFSRPLAVATGERVERDGYAYCDLVIG